MNKNFSIKFLTTAVFCLLLGVAQVFAQAGTGSITGVVTDSNGAVIPNATVKLVSLERGTELTATASQDGIFNFTTLEPGKYSVSASGGSFAEQKFEVEVQVGRTTTANFALGASNVEAQVTVTAEGVQTTQSNSDAVLSEVAIQNLPINGRRFQDFATLTPTAQIDTERNQISLSGQRGINANINVDGVDYNQPFFGGIRGGERSNFAPTIPQESIKEFQVVAAGYNAEYGRSTGGIINVVTKGGTNDFRGSAFYLIRPDNFSINHKFVTRLEEVNNLNIVAAPTQSQFGGSIGGPIVKNRLFFFASYEQQSFTADRFVLFPGLDTITVNSTNAEAINYFRSLQTPYQLTNDARTVLGRLDWNINSVHSLNTRYNWNDGEGLNSVSVGDAGVLFNPVNTNALSNEGTEKDRNNVFVSQFTSTFSSAYVNDFRFQYAKGERPRFANAQSPLVNVANTGAYGTRSFLPTTQFDERIQFVDGFSVLKGNHNIKFGGEFSDIYVDQLFGFNQFGSYSFSGGQSGGLTSLSLDPSNPADRRFDSGTFYTQQIGNLQAAFRIKELAFYGQDSWRITPKFTINFGLRLEKQYNPSAEGGNDVIINAIRTTNFPLRGQVDPTFIPDSEWQVGPRLGFAWDINGDGKSVLRAFSGVYYARTPALLIAGPVNNFRIPPGDVTVQLPFRVPASLLTQSGLATFIAANPGYLSILNATGATNCTGPAPDVVACAPTSVFRQFALIGINANTAPLNNLPSLSANQISQIAGILGLGITPAIGANLIAMAPDYKNPRSLQFGGGYEREISEGFVIGLDYSQVNTTRLQRNRDVNLPVPLTGSQYADFLIAANANFPNVLNGPVFQAAINELRFTNRPIFGVSVPTGLPTCAVVANPCPSGTPQNTAVISRPTRARPISQIGRLLLRESTGISQFRALTFRMRLVRSWANINAYYTLSRNTSDDDNERNATGIFYDNTYDLRSEYGLARLDRTHQFVANPVFFLPYGFEVSSALRFRSGLPIDVTVGSDLNGDTISNDRPFLVPGYPMQRNAFRNRNEYGVDVRAQKGFKFFGENRRLVFSAEIFNLFNNANIQFASRQTNYCANTADRTCGLNGVTNTTFREVRDANGDLITSNFSRTPVFQVQFGARLQF